VTASFLYDGDGKRVQATVNGVTTQFVGSQVEWQSSTTDMLRYYYTGGVRVAMRTGDDGLVWLVGDHLGSTSIAVTDASGATERQGYKAWGETRFGSLPTKYQYTGQRNEPALGMYYYGARWYDSSLARFSQADTIIPDQYNVLDYDRYQYVRSNPTNHTDPSGHRICDLDGYCGTRFDDAKKDKSIPICERINEDGELISGNCPEETTNLEDALKWLSTHTTNSGCPTDVGKVLFCIGLSAEQAEKFWDNTGSINDILSWLDLLFMGTGLAIDLLAFLTSAEVISAASVSLLLGALISPEAIVGVGILLTAGGIYLAHGSIEMGDFRDQMIESGLLQNGGTITVSLFQANSPLAITIDTPGGRTQFGNWNVIPTLLLFLWATKNLPGPWQS
jgi:RHS repeat-associated protein